jgi:predicted metal-dependent hydrolase
MENEIKKTRKYPITEVKLNELFKLAKQQVLDAGIQYGDLRGNIVVNKRAQKFWGRCNTRTNPKTKESYSYIEVAYNLLYASDEEIMNTIIHEILHSCEGCQNHGDIWKKYANIMNKKYGYNVKRATSSEEKGLTELTYQNAKYLLQCDKCGTIIYKSKMCRIVAHPEYFCCSKCKGHFKRIK